MTFLAAYREHSGGRTADPRELAGVVDADRVRTAFALDTVIAYVVGPLIVTGNVAFAPPVVVMAAVTCMTMGILVLLLTRGAVNASRAVSAPGRRMSLMPVTHGGVRTILLMVAFHIFAAGCHLWVHRPHSGRGEFRLLPCGPGLLMLLVGLVGGAIDTLLQLALSDAAPPESRTEAFAWLGTVTWASTAAGTAVGGQLVAIGNVGPSVALLVGTVAMAVAALRATRIPGGAGTVIGDLRRRNR